MKTINILYPCLQKPRAMTNFSPQNKDLYINFIPRLSLFSPFQVWPPSINYSVFPKHPLNLYNIYHLCLSKSYQFTEYWLMKWQSEGAVGIRSDTITLNMKEIVPQIYSTILHNRVTESQLKNVPSIFYFCLCQVPSSRTTFSCHLFSNGFPHHPSQKFSLSLFNPDSILFVTLLRYWVLLRLCFCCWQCSKIKLFPLLRAKRLGVPLE